MSRFIRLSITLVYVDLLILGTHTNNKHVETKQPPGLVRAMSAYLGIVSAMLLFTSTPHTIIQTTIIQTTIIQTAP